MSSKQFPNSKAYTGIDYSFGEPVNRNTETGIRFGVIHQNEVLQAWADSCEAVYPDPECECGKAIDTDELPYTCECGEELEEWCLDGMEPEAWILDDGEYKAQQDSYGDIFVMESPYFTYAQFCSPCAPGACHLSNPLDADHLYSDNRCYCFGHDFFDDEKAPYPVYSVKTNKRVLPPECPHCGGRTFEGYCRACNYPTDLGHI